MWVVCAICGRTYVENLPTGTETHHICDKCRKEGWTIEEKVSDNTKSDK